MINILFVSHTSQVSGAEKVLLRLISYFDINRISPTVICPENGRLVEDLKNQNVTIKLIPMPLLVRTYNPAKLVKYCLAFYRYARQLSREIKVTKADIIHCNSFTSTLYSILSAKLTKTPLLWHMHDILKDSFFNKIFVKLANLGADKIICVSYATKEGLVKFGVTEDKCEVIYNSICADEANSDSSIDFRQEIGVAGNTKIISMIGQIAGWKGQHVLIEAVRELKKKCSNFKCVIVGDIISPATRAYREFIYEKVCSLDVKHCVIFTGFKKNVTNIIINSDIIVHASVRADPLPTVIIEAMHFGKPVVATNVGGVPELVINNKTGLIVPPEDPIALADAIAELFDDRQKAEEMGALGKQIAQRRFDWRRNLRKVLQLYDRLLPNKRIFDTLIC